MIFCCFLGKTVEFFRKVLYHQDARKEKKESFT